MIDEVNIIETNIENTYVKLGNIRVESPWFARRTALWKGSTPTMPAFAT